MNPYAEGHRWVLATYEPYAEGHKWVLATYEPYAEGHKWVLATHEPYAEGHFSDVSSAEGKSSLRTRFLVGSSGSN
jgi:hypothetical protein